MQNQPDGGQRGSNLMTKGRQDVRFHLIQPPKPGDIDQHQSSAKGGSILQNDRKYSRKKKDLLLVPPEKEGLLQVIQAISRTGPRSRLQVFSNLLWKCPFSPQRIRQSLCSRVHAANFIMFTQDKERVRQRSHHRADDL